MRTVPATLVASLASPAALVLALLLSTPLVVASFAGDVQAAGSPDTSSREDGPPPAYALGVEFVEKGDFEKARKAFETAQRKAPRDPDVLNMLAYTQRKTGQLDRAISTYQRALKLRPRFPQAREYLAEAYLQAALRELETLESYGDEATKERDQVIRALEAAARREAWGATDAAAPKRSW